MRSSVTTRPRRQLRGGNIDALSAGEVQHRVFSMRLWAAQASRRLLRKPAGRIRCAVARQELLGGPREVARPVAPAHKGTRRSFATSRSGRGQGGGDGALPRTSSKRIVFFGRYHVRKGPFSVRHSMPAVSRTKTVQGRCLPSSEGVIRRSARQRGGQPGQRRSLRPPCPSRIRTPERGPRPERASTAPRRRPRPRPAR